MRKVTLILALAAVASFASNAMAGSSKYGCDSCHTAHNAAPETATEYGVPLWSNKQLDDQALPTYDLYTGSAKFQSLGITMGQPDGPSKLCLGCHDGTYTSGQMFASTDAMARSHPMSFVYDTALFTAAGGDEGTLYDPAIKPSGLTPNGTVATDMLDTKGKIQCTSCHEVHNNAAHEHENENHHMKFDRNLTLCKSCHNK
jgi:hypothetical protein